LVGIEGGVVSVVINLESPALKRRPGDHAMKNVTSKPEPSHSAIETNSHLFDDWFDPIEDMIRGQVRGLIEEMIRGELDATSDLLISDGCDWSGVIAKLFAKSMRPTRKAG
jgi:hypothetical protein